MNFMRNINNTKRVDKVITTKQYDRSYNKLKKDHRNDVIKDINNTVDDLINLKINTQKSNHRLTGTDVNDLHIRGDVLLLYRYSNNVLTISLQLIDLTNHNKLKNSAYQKQIKKTIKNLNENKGDKKMKYMNYTPSDVNAITAEFEFKNKITEEDVRFEYEVPFETFIEAVKEYFDVHYEVTLDGRDNKIWNMLVDLGEMVDEDIIQEFIDNEDIQESLREKVKEEAEAKFDELCQEEADEEVDDEDEEDLNESYEIDKLEESDLYPILEARGVQEKDLERAANIVYFIYFDENFESGFADDMESKEDLLDYIDGDLDDRVEQLYGDEPFAANFDEDDIEWLKSILNLN